MMHEKIPADMTSMSRITNKSLRINIHDFFHRQEKKRTTPEITDSEQRYPLQFEVFSV